MKTLLCIREREYAWTQEAFPAIHPLLLPLCNKPFIEFLIDFAVLTGSNEVRLLCDGPLSEVERYCEDGSRWGVKLSFGSLQPEDSVEILIAKNRKFCSSERVMVLNGFNFIRYDKRREYASLVEAAPNGKLASCDGGGITLAGAAGSGSENSADEPLSLIPLDSMANFYKASIEALESGEENYVLPGYGGEPGCAIGRNVVISKSVEIRKPASIGDNVQLLPGTVIGPSAIIGSNVIIDKESKVARSIVLDNTYLGEGLEVNDRIASGNLLIEPQSGASIAMEDPHLLSSIRQGKLLKTLPRTVVHSLISLLAITILLIPFLLLWPLLRLTGKWTSTPTDIIDAKRSGTITLGRVVLGKQGALNTLAAALSLDLFPMLFRVLAGQLALIGSTPALEETAGMFGYRPGVFSYAEAEEWPGSGDSEDAAIVESFHIAHSNPVSDIGLFIKAYINRLQEKSTA